MQKPMPALLGYVLQQNKNILQRLQVVRYFYFIKQHRVRPEYL